MTDSSGLAARRLTAIVFTDIVGYSAVVHRDEKLGAQLLDRQREVVRRIVPRHGGREVETAGDSFLLEFSSALAAVQAVIAVQQELAGRNEIEPVDRRVVLRASVHLGDVEHRGKEVYGDGVNTAARLLPHSPEGGMALSAPVLGMIQQRIQLPARSIGSPPLKNIASPVEIFVLDAAALLGVQAPAPTVSAAPFGTSSSQAYRRRALAALAAVLAVAAVLAGGWYFRPGARLAQDSGKSVAVLPFDNLSSEKDSQYFTDGLQDSVITHLAGVHDLRVISRTSVMSYRGGGRNLKEIAQALGVANIVEASVQRAGNRLHVNAQLVRTATDEHVWAEEFDRDVSDVFKVQAELAERIAQSVRANLTPEEKARIEKVPTQNIAAYELYLRALDTYRQPYQAEMRGLRRAVEQLEQAVALDPKFAKAYALLSILQGDLRWYGLDTSEARLAKAREAAETALRLDAELAEAHQAMGYYLYKGFRDYAGATRELEQARRLAPGSAVIQETLALVLRRQGRWDEALAIFAATIQSNPRDEASLENYAQTLNLMRRFEEADRAYARLVAVAARPEFARIWRAMNQLHGTGDLAPLAAATGDLPSEPDPGCTLAAARALVRYLRREFSQAAAAVLACPEKDVVLAGGAGSVPREVIAATYLTAGGDAKAAAPYWREGRRGLEQSLHDNPDQPFLRSYLAWSLAVSGDRQAALAEADRALAELPLTRDAMAGAFLLFRTARVHAFVGENARALDELERSLAVPGPSAHVIDLDAAYDPLRKDPRFRKLIADSLPKR